MARDTIDTVLFDLDGTVLDTAGDLGNALNVVLTRHNRAALPMTAIRPYVSKGGMALVRLGFGDDDGDAAEESRQAWLDELLKVYRADLSSRSVLFAGVDELLTRLENCERRFGIITNKAAFLTEPLLDELKLTERFSCIVSGDTVARRKPDPDQLLHACELIGSSPARSVYIGDDARDIEAGKRAGMRTIAAGYGYILPDDDPHTWGADAVVDDVVGIEKWLEGEGVI